MKNVIKLAAKSDCTGCGACIAVCPKSAITFKHTNSLHFYPEIDFSKCVACETCIKICPQLSSQNHSRNKSLSFFAAYNNDAVEREAASSGGVSGALALKGLNDGHYVCGVGFDNEWYLSHIVSKDVAILDKIRGSKYLFSDASYAIGKIRTLLCDSKKVLFFGTPCQVDGLVNTIPQKYRGGLITCEILCHGVNSPIVWSDYISWLQTCHHGLLTSYNFRSKSHGWGNSARGGANLRVAYTMDNGVHKDVPAYKNLFHSWFGHHYMMRESCFRCKYRSEHRISDITIGDFWGVENILTIESQSKGVSAVLCNTLAGAEFVRQSNLHLIEVDADKTKSMLKGYSKQIKDPEPQLRSMREFEQEYLSYGFKYMARKYRTQTLLERIFAALKCRLHI